MAPHACSSMKSNHLIAFIVLVLSFVSADCALHHLAPISLSTVGRRDSANAVHYGWGFDPGERIHLRDPDTGEVFIAPANNHGWRDVDREYTKPDGTFRILALGDSNTFGVLVPAEETWTRLLERQLVAAGWRAEVINVGYPQWGTDQELEALRIEGIRYRPDLVILQFTINDLTDNTDVIKTDATRKPFYYTLGSGDALERHDNPAFRPAVVRDPVRAVAARSEILKRSYLLATNIAHRFRHKYVAVEPSIDQLRLVLGLGDGSPLISALSERIGSGLSPRWLDALIERTGHAADGEMILRILENQPLKRFWVSLQYDPAPPAPTRDEWRLLLRLVREIQATAASGGAELALLSDQEEGLYEWERYWYRIGPGAEIKANYLKPTSVLRDFASKYGIGFVENREKHVRARNDPHPNREGTRAMAANVYAYVVSRYRSRLDATRP